jgi:O-antigen/teichoic acid export membrane protein
VAAADSTHEAFLAIRNTAKLVSSLVVVWGIGLGMRLVVPRYLGPALFGELNFADAFAATLAVAFTLGADVYIRKEISVRPEHARDFFGGVLVLRLGIALVLTAVIAAVMALSHRPPEVQRLVYIFSAAQFFVSLNAALSAMLQSHGKVGGMSVLSIATKIIWALGFLAALTLHTGLWAFAASFLASEGVETFALYALARRHIGLRLQLDSAATRALVVFGLPFYLKTAAQTAYTKMDVSFLALGADNVEVGWYGSASTLANLALLVAPLISWVLMPMYARAIARSREELFQAVRRSLELILSVSIPLSLAIAVGADVWIHLVFGASFAPAATALRILAPMFVVTYVGIVCSMALTLLDRGWSLTAIAIGGFAVNFGLNSVLIQIAIRRLGPGGGGAGCATAMLGTEVAVTTAMLVMVGRSALDRRVLTMVVKCAVGCAIAVALDRACAFLGPLRLVPAAAGYLAFVLLSRALPIGEIAGMVRGAYRRPAPDPLSNSRAPE